MPSELEKKVDELIQKDIVHLKSHDIIDGDIQILKEGTLALQKGMAQLLQELKNKNLIHRMDKLEEQMNYVSKTLSDIKDELLDNVDSVRNKTLRNTERIEHLESQKEKLEGRTSDLVWKIISYIAIAGVAWLLAGKIG